MTTRQLAEVGVGGAAVTIRVQAGRLHRLHRGVYAVGHVAVSRQGRWLAAVLACGDGAVLSHRDATAHWGVLPAIGGPVHVTVPGRAGRAKRRGLTIHRPCVLTSVDVTRHLGIPITAPARTLADLRRVLDPSELRRAIRQAEVLGLSLGADLAADRTRSELEHLFLRLCRRHRLPIPEVNARVGRLTVDFLWRDRRLIVETDGYRYHRGRQAFEDDRARDLQLRLLGYEVLRFSHRQVTLQGDRVAELVAAALVTT